MELLYAIIAIVFGVLNIILFFKIWGMTNDIRDIRYKFIFDEKHKLENKLLKNDTNYTIGDIVVDKKTGKEMKINSYNPTNKKFACYINDGLILAGYFHEDEITLKTEKTIDIDQSQLSDLENKMKENQCIVYVVKNSKLEIWDKYDWEEIIKLGRKEYFKLIRKNF